MKPHKIFGIENIEGAALAQFYDAMKQDYVVQGALMPDAHAGYALPIGAVVATKGVIVPAWVGYDIGCGLCAIPTLFDRAAIEANKKAIFDQIYRDVPTGFDHNGASLDWNYQRPYSDFVRTEIVAKGAPGKQIGTLGGGNHFIEIGHDEQDRIWIIIHSGSRNVGHKIATHYMKLASGDDKAREGHYGLPVDSQVGQDYIYDLAFGLQFALDNRKSIAHRVVSAINRVLKTGLMSNANYAALINRNHNHAECKFLSMEEGIEVGVSGPVWIHRKGATHAEDGMLGVIPGNMRDGSFIVRGKGNPDSLFSSSHGAGRVLSRSRAKETLNMDDFKATMTASGEGRQRDPGRVSLCLQEHLRCHEDAGRSGGRPSPRQAHHQHQGRREGVLTWMTST